MSVFEHYSGDIPKCAYCGETNSEFLSIDHINNNGAQHEKTLSGRSSETLYRWLMKNDYPDGFQVLCMNCNCAKEWLGHVSHNPIKTSSETPARCLKLYQQKIKVLVLGHYSDGTPKCACCGETHIESLTIDHINNDGAQHRKITECGSGTTLYLWLKKNGYPGEFQVLCMNCNWAKGRLGYCPHDAPKEPSPSEHPTDGHGHGFFK